MIDLPAFIGSDDPRIMSVSARLSKTEKTVRVTVHGPQRVKRNVFVKYVPVEVFKNCETEKNLLNYATHLIPAALREQWQSAAWFDKVVEICRPYRATLKSELSEISKSVRQFYGDDYWFDSNARIYLIQKLEELGIRVPSYAIFLFSDLKVEN